MTIECGEKGSAERKCGKAQKHSIRNKPFKTNRAQEGPRGAALSGRDRRERHVGEYKMKPKRPGTTSLRQRQRRGGAKGRTSRAIRSVGRSQEAVVGNEVVALGCGRCSNIVDI